MDRLRTPFLAVALAAVVLVVLVELAGPLLPGGHRTGADLSADAVRLGVVVPPTGTTGPPGRAIPYLALVDGPLLFTVALMGAGLLVPDRVHGRLQGPATLVFAAVLVPIAVTLLTIAVAQLVLMLTLLLSVPFGTVAYLAGWGYFPYHQATVLLSLLMLLKLVFAGCLLAAHERFLANKGLVALALTSLACTVVAVLLPGLVPAVLASILDDVAAIVIAAVGTGWALILVAGSVVATVRAVRAAHGREGDVSPGGAGPSPRGRSGRTGRPRGTRE
jgi:hypothetical protein